MAAYQATYPAGLDYRDVLAQATTGLPQPPDFPPQLIDGNIVQVVYTTFVPSAQQLTTWQSAVAAIAADPNAPWRNRDTLGDRARNALATNTTYLGLGAPSNAQVIAQVRALTQECSALIRLMLGELSSTS